MPPQAHLSSSKSRRLARRHLRPVSPNLGAGWRRLDITTAFFVFSQLPMAHTRTMHEFVRRASDEWVKRSLSSADVPFKRNGWFGVEQRASKTPLSVSNNLRLALSCPSSFLRRGKFAWRDVVKGVFLSPCRKGKLPTSYLISTSLSFTSSRYLVYPPSKGFNLSRLDMPWS
ncbi:hypothetical protein M440DRAFT_267177 [Trichoderma longibrachiatum ATCC 18648]|uniref:Uncharacterized protein n=1 Tax=Trichoderma longibrachiatum ATCC 18648 TaxID=983965 RepID=A0A2T4CAS9_TRILO|nr:hypothetical protein M440DRAFT_267177 [Trichoderma longibrachiatum ATCC 18648]